jgi:hypothetical protein
MDLIFSIIRVHFILALIFLKNFADRFDDAVFPRSSHQFGEIRSDRLQKSSKLKFEVLV